MLDRSIDGFTDRIIYIRNFYTYRDIKTRRDNYKC